jgi:UDP-glucose 4-epimerase
MLNKTVLVTGSQGFIGTYICNELLNKGYKVLGIDNFSKYGKVIRPHDDHPNFYFKEGNVINITEDFFDEEVDYIINLAAMIGGISYFHKYAYDLLAHNERISASIFDYAIKKYQKGELKRFINISSSMVFESTDSYPTSEENINISPPPISTYGFQKLATEYFCKGANEQYGLPYTIIRPFNCVGVGEDESLNSDVLDEGNIKMMMSHVLPDLAHRAINLGKDKPLPILGSGEQVRHYTNGKDLARGIIIAMESKSAENEDFNLSTKRSTTVKELVRIIYDELYGKETKLIFSHLNPFQYDVQKRVPDTSKAKELLGFECEISLEQSVKEVIEWIKKKR